MNAISNHLYVVEHYAFKYQDGYIFMDVNTLDVYVLDEMEYGIIKGVKARSVDNELSQLFEVYGEGRINKKTKELLENGILKSVKDAKCTSGSNADREKIKSITSIDILLSEDCNMACKYCFVKNGQYHGKSALMGLDVGKKAIDFLIQRSGNRNDLHVCFFGGEPLMNFKLLKDIVAYAKEEGEKFNKSFRFTITTNGTLLNDEIVDFFHKYRIKVTLSIDGDAASNDINRPLKNGGSSYAAITRMLEKLDQRNISYAARVTISSLTMDRIADNYEHLISLGFKRIHLENAYGPKGEIFISNKSDIEKVKKQYSLIGDKAIDKIGSDRRFNIETLPFPLGKIVNKRAVSHSCAAGRGYVAVDVNGSIYLCHRLVGNEEFRIGNVVQDTFDTGLSAIFEKDMNVENRKKCKNCWARYLCGGGCYAINYEFNKDIDLVPQIYCQQKKHSIKLALAVYASAGQ